MPESVAALGEEVKFMGLGGSKITFSDFPVSGIPGISDISDNPPTA